MRICGAWEGGKHVTMWIVCALKVFYVSPGSEASEICSDRVAFC